MLGRGPTDWRLCHWAAHSCRTVCNPLWLLSQMLCFLYSRMKRFTKAWDHLAAARCFILCSAHEIMPCVKVAGVRDVWRNRNNGSDPITLMISTKNVRPRQRMVSVTTVTAVLEVHCTLQLKFSTVPPTVQRWPHCGLPRVSGTVRVEPTCTH